MAKVLVTGYGGFLGQAIVRRLLAAGYQVRGLARGNYAELQALGVEGVSGSVTDRSLVDQAVQGCDAIIQHGRAGGSVG